MTRVMLGLRLAARAGRARMFAVVGCSALGILLLLLCLDFPDALHNPQDFIVQDDRPLFRALISVVAVPMVVLIASISRLSSDTRDRRLFTLRLMGLSPRGAGVVAAAETGALVFVGAIFGALLHGLVAGALWREALKHGLGHQVPPNNPLRDGALVIVSALLVAVVSARPAQRSGASLIQAARREPRRRLTYLLALIGLAGFITAGVLAALPNSRNDVAEDRIPYMGFALITLIIGILGLASTACGLLAHALKRTESPANIIAAARTESDRASLGRAFAGLGAATFATAFGLSVFTVFTTTPQYKSAAYWQRHETSFLASPLVDAKNGLTELGEYLKHSPDVVKATPGYRIDNNGVAAYEQVTSLSCDQVRAQAKAQRCSDTQPWAANVTSGTDGTRVVYGSGQVPHYPSVHSFVIDGKKIDVSPAFATSVKIHDASSDASFRQFLSENTLVLPPSWLAQHGFTTNAYFVVIKPGSRLAWDRNFQSKYAASNMPDMGTWDRIAGFRHLTYLLIAVVMSVGLLTVIVSVLDLLAERRRRVASLRMMGIPTSTLRSAQFLSTLVPMAATLTLTLVAGYLMGRAYLNFAGEAGSTPTSQLTELLGIMLLFGIALAAATTSGLGRPLTANLIRRE